ncbi:MAG: cell envelope integrity protein TolA [Burkholderiaceae bacterium]
MHAAAERLEFAPPPTRGLVRAMGLAILAHAALLAALTWGVRWKREAVLVSAQAELWAAVPQEVAPKAVPDPPAAVVTPPPAPVLPKVQPPTPDITLERERKLREQKLARQQAEQEKREKLLREAEKKKKLETQLAVERKKQEMDAQRKEAQKQQQEAQRKEVQKQQQEAQRKEVQKQQQEAARVEAQRKDNLARMAGLAGSTGAATATGTAAHSAGPSASYTGKIVGRVRPNIVFTESPAGNPTAVIEVRTAPDGTIVGRKLIKSSGMRSWDDAVMKALEKTDSLPRDVDGRVPPVLELSMRPRD